MKYFILGLGNKGEEYSETRHNTGFMMIDYLQSSLEFSSWKENSKAKAQESSGKIGNHTIVLIKPEQFMNNNGKALAFYIKSKADISRLIVIYDELDLPIGKMKMAHGRSSGGHRGLESVIRTVKSKDFIRIRVGISPESNKGVAKKPKGEDAVIKFILGKFKDDDKNILKKEKIKIKEGIENIVKNGFERAMGEFN